MTWQGKRRKQLPTNWAAIRKQRLELDGYRCTATVERTNAEMRMLGSLTTQRLVGDRCTARATEVDHHLNPDDHRLSSLRSLCQNHHEQRAGQTA